MKISRHNYEEWFILYLDDELSSEDRREVEQFVQENPDLQSELDILLQSKLSPDPTEIFPDRQQLLRSMPDKSITLDNYEETLLSYIDGELPEEEKIAVKKFLDRHPEIKPELELLEKTKLQPEPILFPDKASLYRREEKVRVIGINWRRIAIAASLLLAVGTTAIMLLNGEKETQEISDSGNRPVEKNTTPAIDRVEQNQVALQHEGDNKEKNAPVIDASNDNVIAQAEKTKQSSAMPGKQDQVKREEPQLAVQPVQKQNANELPEPVYNPNVIRTAPQDNPIAMTEIPEKDPLTISTQNSPAKVVTPGATEPLYTSNTSTENYEPVDAGHTGKKNKLRGFFRKITRTFEKNTNIKATDDEDRLLIGGLAIQL